jgi:hypothetical protein
MLPATCRKQVSDDAYRCKWAEKISVVLVDFFLYRINKVKFLFYVYVNLVAIVQCWLEVEKESDKFF